MREKQGNKLIKQKELKQWIMIWEELNKELMINKKQLMLKTMISETNK